MNDSLVQPVSYNWSSDSNNNMGVIAQDISTVIPDILTSTITISNGGSSSYYYNTGSTMTINSTGSIGIGSTTISGASTSTFNWKVPEEFVDAFPDYNRIEKMCEEYPGLAIAFEKFKTVYNLVKDHYDTPEDKRPKP